MCSSDLIAMGFAARIQKTGPRDLYFLVAQSGLLIWLWRVLGCGDSSTVLVTAAWFTNAIVLVVAGLRSNSSIVRTAGAAVMTLTMTKLFIIDLAEADALWRVVIFLIFGVVLLGLGYAFPTLWRRDRED